MERFQKKAILADLNKKMVLLSGPRQAGKTTLAKEIGAHFSSSIYLNYDRLEDRKILKQEAWLPTTELLIFDELHKMPKWKNYLKGVYDTKLPSQKILVTGSARLEVFQQVGDSLAGRFFLHRLLPLSPAECLKVGTPFPITRFLERGGFPEPFLAEDPVDSERWRLQYVDSLLRVDVLEFDNIQNLKAIQLLFTLLRERVGSPVSYQSLSEDIGVSPNTVKKYIQILEALYIVFRVTPFSKNIARSLLKEPKIYFFDTGLVVGDSGARFENFIALSLLKHTYAKVDYEAKLYTLHYLSTKERQEVDFALVNNKTVETIIETKYHDTQISPSLRHFHEKYNFKAVQVVESCKREYVDKKIEVLSGKTLTESLFL
ncbi:MAG: ATP-binding protein [Verrucomicrobia bacterium]|nr:ATP-binding protein [Verrucomicrobiota bacterium]